MLVFLVCLSFAVPSLGALSCRSFLPRNKSSKFSYIGKGTSGVTFEKDGVAYKVYRKNFDEDIYYGFEDSKMVAAEEALLLRIFKEIVDSAGLSDFFDVSKSVDLKAGEEALLIDLAHKMFPNEIFDAVAARSYINGEDVNDKIMDSDVSIEVRIDLLARWNDAVQALAEAVSAQSKYALSPLLPHLDNKVAFETVFIESRAGPIAVRMAEIQIMLKVPGSQAPEERASVFISNGSNTVMDAQGVFVLIDPN